MKKQQTFTLDINFFDDDRMIPVSALFGPVGELVAIRLISLIYRNGYYLEWTELNRCRLLRAIPSLTLEQLDAIVDCLISSGLFDADLFTREGILTSVEIQAQYLRAHRRRIHPDTRLPYFIIPIPEKKAPLVKDGELPAPHTETPEIPETLENPETPETLENLDNIENIEILDTSETLENPETFETLEIPETLETPENSNLPAPPDHPKRPLPRGVKLVSSRRPSASPHKYPSARPRLLPTKRRKKR